MHAQLRAAIEAGNFAKVETFLFLTISELQKAKKSSSSLGSPLKQGSITLIDVNARDKSTGDTLLHVAVACCFHAVKVKKKNLGWPFSNGYSEGAQHQQSEKEPNNNNTETSITHAPTPSTSLLASPRQQEQQENLPPPPLQSESARLAIVQSLLAAGADPERCNYTGLTPLQLLKQIETNQSYFFSLPSAFKFSLIGTLVAAGERSWDAVPIPCPGIGQALYSVWQRNPGDLECLVFRLGKKDKIVMQKILLLLQRVLPGGGNILTLRMQILSAALAL
jgi:hypothetical protein